MERAVELVNPRLRATVQILDNTKVPYAVIGGHAVWAWVTQVDETGLRITRDVNILVRLTDLPAVIDAMMVAGFHHRNTTGLDVFVEHPDASTRDAVQVLLVGNVDLGGEPNPDIVPAARAADFQTIELESLVRMKLNALRDKDRVHLLDLVSLAMFDNSWLDCFPASPRLR